MISPTNRSQTGRKSDFALLFESLVIPLGIMRRHTYTTCWCNHEVVRDEEALIIFKYGTRVEREYHIRLQHKIGDGGRAWPIATIQARAMAIGRMLTGDRKA